MSTTSNMPSIFRKCLRYIILIVSVIIITYISNLVHTTRLWNNLHQVRSKSKAWKDN